MVVVVVTVVIMDLPWVSLLEEDMAHPEDVVVLLEVVVVTGVDVVAPLGGVVVVTEVVGEASIIGKQCASHDIMLHDCHRADQRRDRRDRPY